MTSSISSEQIPSSLSYLVYWLTFWIIIKLYSILDNFHGSLQETIFYTIIQCLCMILIVFIVVMRLQILEYLDKMFRGEEK